MNLKNLNSLPFFLILSLFILTHSLSQAQLISCPVLLCDSMLATDMCF